MFAKKFHLNAFCVLRLLHLCKTNDVSIIFVIVETGFDMLTDSGYWSISVKRRLLDTQQLQQNGPDRCWKNEFQQLQAKTCLCTYRTIIWSGSHSETKASFSTHEREVFEWKMQRHKLSWSLSWRDKGIKPGSHQCRSTSVCSPCWSPLLTTTVGVTIALKEHKSTVTIININHSVTWKSSYIRTGPLNVTAWSV